MLRIFSLLLALFVAPIAPAQSSKPVDLKYVAAISGKIKSNILYTEKEERLDNPSASFAVELSPNYEVMSVKKIKNSGILAYAAAIEHSIWKSSPLPAKEDGTWERDLTLNFRLRDDN